VSGFTLSHVAKIYIFMILYVFCLLHAQFRNTALGSVKAAHEPVCALESEQRCGEPCFSDAAISVDRCLPHTLSKASKRTAGLWTEVGPHSQQYRGWFTRPYLPTKFQFPADRRKITAWVALLYRDKVTACHRPLQECESQSATAVTGRVFMLEKNRDLTPGNMRRSGTVLALPCTWLSGKYNASLTLSMLVFI
jgi:hypothetical protein